MPNQKKPLKGVERGRYYEAYSEGRGRDREHVVKVWKTDEKVGEPAGDWGMPGALPLYAAVDQAILNTIGDEKKEGK